MSSLYEYIDPGLHLYLWTIPGRKTHPFPAGELQAMVAAAGQLSAAHDVYFGLGATAQPLPPNERAKADSSVAAIPGLWIDIDVRHPVAHSAQNLPPDVPAAMGLLPAELPPSIIVWSGYGIHVYWLFREPWIFDGPEERRRAAKLLKSLQAVIKNSAACSGWKLDTTSDLARVMRVPGTLNRKLPDSPVMAQVMESSDVRYNPTEIEDVLSGLQPATETPAAAPRSGSFERRPTDGSTEAMLRNCRFMQHCQINAAKITYDEWLAALTNIVRGTDGEQTAHQISAMDPARYKPEDINKKITEALAMNPQSCEYIRSVIGFAGCPQTGCGVQAPCGWSLSKLAQARAVIRSIPAPAPESVFTPETLGALAVLKKDDQAEYSRFRAACKGRVNLHDLDKALKQLKQTKRKDSPLRVVGSDSPPAEKSGPKMLRDTVPALPVDLEAPSGFKFGDSGISFIKLSDNEPIYLKAAGAPVVISERLFNVDTETEKLEICFRYLAGWRRALFPRSTIFDSRKILRLADYGVPVSSESAKYLVKFFDALAGLNESRIPVTQAVSKLGWRGDREFVLPNLDSRYRIDIDDDGSQRTVSGFTTAGDYAEWLSRMRYLRQSPKARFVLAASFAAPLLRILGQRNFILHNWGGSQDGKSATLWAAMSAWGNPDRLLGTFDATHTGMERKAALHSDLPLAVNEREVLSKFKKQDINPLLYILGEGRGRIRGTKTGLQDLATWRTVVLSTGEGTLSSDGSLDGVMTRVLEICDGPLAHDREFARSLYYFLPRNHGHAGPEFLRQLLASDYGVIFSTYREFQAAFRVNFPDRIDSHIDAVACVAAADYVSSAWIFGEPWEQAKVEAMNTAGHILAGLITRSEASESERAWAAFIDWLAENQERLTDKFAGPKIGYQELKSLYIIRDVVNRFLDERFSGNRRILKEWAATGKIGTFLRAGKQRYDTMGKTLDGGIRPCVIKIKNFEAAELEF